MPTPLPRHRTDVEGEGQVKPKRSSQIYPREDNLRHWRNGILSLSAEAPGPPGPSGAIMLAGSRTKRPMFLTGSGDIMRNLHFSTIHNETYHGTSNELRELLALELSTLPKIRKVVVDSSVTHQLSVTELILHDKLSKELHRQLFDLL
ncbi:hypothetical protein L1987_09702 [Smallanthus sonchifolius]|uniref:Uncharacterized protein n=1 Tax=Smallanthus sonchifolius TaxID=185202 RepID=A0ACB9JQ35_9ASTR|nr:hypothetical protein L1987_09702 [Smallanthus sonchifolius]